MRIFRDEGNGGDPAAEANLKMATEAATKAGGTFFTEKTWRETLPQDLRTHPSLAKVANFEGMARSLINAQGLIGQDPNRLTVIPDGKDDAALLAHFDRLGRPKDATGYKLEPVQGAPDFLKPEGEFTKSMAALAHKAGLLPKQFQGLYSGFTAEMAKAAKAQADSAQEQHDKNLAAMQAKHGDGLDAHFAAANRGVQVLGGNELMDVLNAAGLGTHPLVVAALAKAAALTKEDGVGGGGGGGGNEGADDLVAQAKELQQKAINTDNPRERRRLNEEAHALYERVQTMKNRKRA